MKINLGTKSSDNTYQNRIKKSQLVGMNKLPIEKIGSMLANGNRQSVNANNSMVEAEHLN